MKRSMMHRSWPLLVVIAVAVASRVGAVDWGLPYVTDPDEPTNLTRTLLMLQNGDPNPHWFHYPSLLFYLNAGTLALAGATRGAFNPGPGIESVSLPEMVVFGTGIIPEPWTLMVPRLTTLLVSVLMVVVVYLTIHRVTGQRWAAALGGSLMAVSPLAVSHGALFTPDPLSALFAGLVIWAAVRIYERGAPADYFLAGVAVGLATGSKYNAAFIGLAVLVAHFLRHSQGGETWSRGPITSIYVAVGVFLMTTPFAIFDSATFLSHVGFELVHYSTGHAGAVGGLGVYAEALFWSYAAALVLPIVGFRESSYRPYLILTWVVAVGYTLFVAIFPTTFLRNLLPALPVFAVSIGIGAAAMSKTDESTRVSTPVLLGVIAAVSLLVAVLAPEVEGDGRADRSEARTWLAESIPDGSNVVVEWMSPWIDPSRVDVVPVDFIAQRSLPNDWDYLVVSVPGSLTFLEYPDLYPGETERYDAIAETTCLIRSFPGVAEVRASDC